MKEREEKRYVLLTDWYRLMVPGVSRKKKELMKAMETPEEKRLRRVAKKETKERKQRLKEGWDLVRERDLSSY